MIRRNLFLPRSSHGQALARGLVQALIGAALATSLAYVLVRCWDEVPSVRKDWVTGECVAVDQVPLSAVTFTCSNLPPRYEVVWVRK